MQRGLLVLGVLAACERGDAMTATSSPPAIAPPVAMRESGLPDIQCPAEQRSVIGFLIESVIPPPEGMMAIEYEGGRLAWLFASLFGPPAHCAGQCCAA